MNTLPVHAIFEPRWKTYLKAATFLTPPICIWVVGGVFLFPKIKMIWRDAGFQDLTAQGFMNASDFAMHHGLSIFIAVILLLGFLEWRNGRWPRYRQASLGIFVFLLNSAVLVLMTWMLISVLLLLPGLLPRG
jgi:hypothetical protein